MSSKRKIKTLSAISIFLSLLMLAGMFATYYILSNSRLPELAASVLSIKVPKKVQRPVKSFLKKYLAQSSVSDEFEKSICDYEPIENPVYQGEFVEKQVRVAAYEGDEFKVNFYLKNTGTSPWFGEDSGCVPLMRLGTARDRDRSSEFAYFTGKKDTGWLEAMRVRMLEDRVNPGELGTFQFISRAPFETDTYREYFQPVVEGKTWLSRPEETVSVDVAVGFIDERDPERLKFINKTGRASIINLDAPREITIDISDQKMIVKVGETVVREYTVSTGTFKTPTPTGEFKVLNKQELRIANKYPHYRMPKWQGFTKWGHGLHALPYLANDKGTFWKEALNHIGRRVSHGCIRLLPDDAEELFTLTDIGDKVVVRN